MRGTVRTNTVKMKKATGNASQSEAKTEWHTKSRIEELPHVYHPQQSLCGEEAEKHQDADICLRNPQC